MATYAVGISATWGSVTFTEVTDLAWTFGGTNVSRGSGFFAATNGSVSITALGTTPTADDVGDRKTLTITGGGVALTRYAVLKQVGAVAELNGVARYSIEFDIVN